MNEYPESNSWNDYPDDDWDFNDDPDMAAEQVAFATESLSKYVNEDTPDRPWQKIVKRQLNPNLVGSLVAVGFAAALVLDVVINNNPSSLVVDHPELATLGVAAGSAAVGLSAAKLTRDANAKELSEARRLERERRKKEENR